MYFAVRITPAQINIERFVQRLLAQANEYFLAALAAVSVATVNLRVNLLAVC